MLSPNAASGNRRRRNMLTHFRFVPRTNPLFGSSRHTYGCAWATGPAINNSAAKWPRALTTQAIDVPSLCVRIPVYWRPTHSRRLPRFSSWRTSAWPPAIRNFEDLAWSVHILGLAYYRAGAPRKAIQHLRKRSDSRVAAWKYDVVNWLVLALAYTRLGDTRQAQEWLDRADRAITEQKSSSRATGTTFVPPGWHWRDWLEVQLLREEAAAAMKGLALQTSRREKWPIPTTASRQETSED
jgi:tetratricopeptide (TPR) repeat protein